MKEAKEVAAEIQELERIRGQLTQVANERDLLHQQLQYSVLARPSQHGKNAVGLPTGPILLVKHQDRYGAVKAIDQASDKRGKFVRYVWWYQPDADAADFLSAVTKTGIGETKEDYPGPLPQLKIGPIELEWSMGGDGQGWVYYGPSSTRSEEYELALTNEVDITRVRVDRYEFQKATALRS